MDNRVVVTGYGAITPLGTNIEDTWQQLISGSSGIDYITLFDATNFGVKIAAEAKGFNPLDYLDPNTARYSDRFSQFAA
jgi:3-oxoacyl-[acyl-carrier-protein] synthase II